MSSPRTRLHSLALLIATVIAGLLVRLVPLGLPNFVVKYAGSMLWALAIYWIVSAALPSSRPLAHVLVAGMIASAVEFFKLYRSPSLDAFRHTLPGILLLGRIFSFRDISAYWVAILLGAAWDRNAARKSRSFETGENPMSAR